jgi:glycine hydroxymethyltransferase
MLETSEALMGHGFDLVTGGTDNHLMLADVTSRGISGRVAAQALNRCGIELNGNSIPFDKRSPFDPSGVRIGTPALSSRGLLPEHMKTVAELIARGVAEAARGGGSVSDEFAQRMRSEVAEFLSPFPAPGL